MKSLPPQLADALSRLARAVGDLWSIEILLASLLASRDLQTEEWIETARRASCDLAPVSERLALLAAALPAPAETASDLGLTPLEFVRASVECVLADRLSPALTDLAALSTGPASRWSLVRASLECILADRLYPAITALTRLLLFGEIPADAETSRPS
jgi:hypothetical protein